MNRGVTVERSAIEFAAWALRKHNFLECADILTAALAAEPGAVEGMVLVPRKRTEEMHWAAQSTTGAVITHKHSADIWAAMIAAAPHQSGESGK